MNIVCLAGQLVTWNSDALECDPPADIRQCGFVLRIRENEDVLCTLIYEGDDAEAGRIEHDQYVVVIGTIVGTKPQLEIQVKAHFSADTKPSDDDVMKFYSDTMRSLQN